MASIKQDPISQMWRIHFRIGDRQFQKSLETKDEKTANSILGRVELTLQDIKLGRKVIPPGADPWVFIRSDGTLTEKPTIAKLHTLAELFATYFDQLTAGAKEANTLRVENIHKGHLLRILGGSKPLTTLTATDIQRYINARTRENWMGKPIRRETIRKEVNTLQMVWNRAEKLLGVSVSDKLFADLDFPKGKQKPPFRTWREIERAIERENLDKEQQKELWDCLFLDSGQVDELLNFVEANQRTPYMYPLLVFAAHTGARLSEIIRSRVEDLKFDSNCVIIHEKKKSQSSETFRQVPMSQRLANVLRSYFQNDHPGGNVTICTQANKQMLDKTLHKAHHTLFRNTTWRVLKGFHVLRHSFASNLACQGVDQRIIDELMGHQTEAMRKRYRHLFPEQKDNAIRRLFDAKPVAVVAAGPALLSEDEEARREESATPLCGHDHEP